jgi:hypothetical protein
MTAVYGSAKDWKGFNSSSWLRGRESINVQGSQTCVMFSLTILEIFNILHDYMC